MTGGSDVDGTIPQREAFLADTPLWFYVLREAELNDGRLTGVGARLVVETFTGRWWAAATRACAAPASARTWARRTGGSG